jgi:hypothetical protein
MEATTALPIVEDEQNLYDWGIENPLGKRTGAVFGSVKLKERY